MKKGLKITGIVLGVLVGLYLVFAITLQVLLTPKVLQRVISRYESALIDGNLTFSDLEISVFENFPFLTVDLDDVAITYPSDRFCQTLDPSLRCTSHQDDAVSTRQNEVESGDALRHSDAETEGRSEESLRHSNTGGALRHSNTGGTLRHSDAKPEGRSEESRPATVDTLASFSCLQASINIVSLLSRRQFDIPVIRLSSPKVNYRVFPSGETSLDVIKMVRQARMEGTVEVEDSLDTSLPDILFGKVELLDNPVFFVNSAPDSLDMTAGMNRLVVGKNISLSSLLSLGMQNFSFDVDSLYLKAVWGRDVIDLHLDKVKVVERDTLYGVYARLNTSLFWRGAYTEVPVVLNGSVITPQKGDFSKFHIKGFKVDFAELPVHVSGDVKFLNSSQIYTNLDATVKEFRLHDLLTHIDGFLPVSASQVGRKSTLSLKATTRGVLSKTQLPLFDADLVVRSVNINSPKDSLVLYVDSLGLYAYHRKARATDLVPVGLDMLGLAIKVDSLDFNYKDAAVLSGRNISSQAQVGSRLLYEKFQAHETDVVPTYATLCADYLRLAGVDSTRLSLKGTENAVKIFPRSDNKKTPHIHIKSSNDRFVAVVPSLGKVFFRDVAASLHLDDISLDSLARDRREGWRGGRPQFGPSQSRHSDADVSRHSEPVEESSASLRHSDAKPEGRSEESRVGAVTSSRTVASSAEFKKYDLKFDFSQGIKTFLREWNFNGEASIRRAFLRTPLYPLPASVSRARVTFDSNNVSLESFCVRTGHSSLSATGKISGIRRIVSRSDATAVVNLAVHVNSLYANELLDAVKYTSAHLGQTFSHDELSDSELQETVGDGDGVVVVDESSVFDGADTITLRAPIIPRNLRASVKLSGTKVYYNNIVVDTLNLIATTRNRTLRVTNLLAYLPQGKLDGSLLYSSQAPKDIKAYADLRLSDIDAAGVIDLVPQIDSLAPMLKSIRGTLNVHAGLRTQLDTLLKLTPGGTEGYLRISGNNLELRDTEGLRKILKLLQFEDKTRLFLPELTIESKLMNDYFQIYPCLIKMDRYVVGAEGTMKNDGSYMYHVDVLKSAYGLKLGLNIFGKDKVNYRLVKVTFNVNDFPSYSDHVDARFAEFSNFIAKF